MPSVTRSQGQQRSPGSGGAAGQPCAEVGVKLYAFVQGAWQLHSAAVQPHFYNGNEDKEDAQADWQLEIDEADIETRADATLEYLVQFDQERVTFKVPETQGFWSLKFPSLASVKQFVETLQDKVYENIYGHPFNPLQADDDNLFQAAEDQAGPMEVDEEDMPAPGEMVQDEVEVPGGAPPCQGIIVGARDKSYLHQGTQFAVLANEAAAVEYTGHTITLSTRESGRLQPVAASQVLLANNETRMNMLSLNNSSALLHADIERGQVVKEWRLQKDGEDIPQIAITHGSKNSQLLDVPDSMLSLASNRLCRWDMRVPEGVVQDHMLSLMDGSGETYTAKSKPNFTCMAASGSGHVVVGSEDGKVRLFSSTALKPAKTTIEGIGKAVTAVDVTYDGKWVLATTDDYLMVVKTTYQTTGGRQQGKTQNAFEKPSRSKMDRPRLLRLKPEDRVLTGNAALKAARFTWVTDPASTADSAERWIVASCGRHTVLWNFRRVKTATTHTTSIGGLPTLMEYTLSAAAENVADSRFMHSDPHSARDALLVATDNMIYTLAET